MIEDTNLRALHGVLGASWDHQPEPHRRLNWWRVAEAVLWFAVLSMTFMVAASQTR